MDDYRIMREGSLTACKIEKILQVLNDGGWHMLSEIGQKTSLSDAQVHKLADFLKEYNFVVLDQDNARIKLDEEAKKFLA
jgi:DNA-binding IclR family transcriptional regulator